MNELERRLANLEARFAISELRSTYCWHTTRGERDAVIALFAEDAVFQNSRGAGSDPVVVRGREAIAQHLAHMRPARRIPLVVNEVTRMIDDDSAEGTCVMTNLGEDPFCGHYIDKFTRIGERWFFSSREFYSYWPQFNPSTSRSAP